MPQTVDEYRQARVTAFERMVKTAGQRQITSRDITAFCIEADFTPEYLMEQLKARKERRDRQLTQQWVDELLSLIR